MIEKFKDTADMIHSFIQSNNLQRQITVIQKDCEEITVDDLDGRKVSFFERE